MQYSFDLLNDIFVWCIQDKEFMKMLGISTTDKNLLDRQNNKLRREYQTDANIESSDVPFISYYFMHATNNTHNYLVNVGDLYIDIYTHTMYEAGIIAKRFREILATHTEIQLNYEGQHYSGVNGVYKYRLIYNPLIDGR